MLYVSEYTNDVVVRYGVCQDQVHFLQKPFTPSGLESAVRQVLRGRLAAAGA